MHRACVLVVAAWGVGLHASVPHHHSVIVNGSAAWSVDRTRPFGWETLGTECVRAHAPGGENRVFCIRHSDEAGSNSPVRSGFLSAGFPAYPDALYVATCKVHLVAATGMTHLIISWYTDDNVWLGNTDDGVRLSGEASWSGLAVCDYPPDDAGYARVGLWSQDNAGEAFFKDVRVQMRQPADTATLPLPGPLPGAAARWRGQAMAQAEYSLGPLVRSDSGAYTYRQERVLTPVSGEEFELPLQEVEGPAYLRKCFADPPSPDGEAPWEARLTECFLVATRWAVPAWLDDAATEMFGGREQLLHVLRGGRPMLQQDPDNLQHKFALYLLDLWSSPDPHSLYGRGHQLALSMGTLDIRCDQVLYVRAHAEASAAQRKARSRLNALEAELSGAKGAHYRGLLLDRLRLHWTLENYQAVVEDADLIRDAYSEAYGPGYVPKFVGRRRAHALFNLGRVSAARQEASDVSHAKRVGDLAEPMQRIRWHADVAEGNGGPVPGWVGDRENADGMWPGRFGTAGAYVLGPGNSHDEFGFFDRCSPQVRAGTLGIMVRTHCAEFPSSAKHAPYNPYTQCKSDCFWDDRGEAWATSISGPDIVVSFRVPAGLFRASALTSGYTADLFLGDMSSPLDTAPLREGDRRLYRQFFVVGPATYRLHLQRGKRLMTYLAGLFLDPVGPDFGGCEEPVAAARKAWGEWAAWCEAEPQDALSRLVWLTRQAARPPEATIRTAAQAVLQSGGEDALGAALVDPKHAGPALLHALAAALAHNERVLATVEPPFIGRMARALAGAYDLAAITDMLTAYARVRPDEGIEWLHNLADRARYPEVTEAALSVLCDTGRATGAEREELARSLKRNDRHEEAQSILSETEQH